MYDRGEIEEYLHIWFSCLSCKNSLMLQNTDHADMATEAKLMFFFYLKKQPQTVALKYENRIVY